MFVRGYLFGFIWKYCRFRQLRFAQNFGGYSQFRRWLKWRPQLLVAFSAGFSFQDNGIRDHEVQQAVGIDNDGQCGSKWELIVENDDYKVTRRLIEDSGLYEYQCYGTYRDITAKDFIDAQFNLEYRKCWDVNVIELEVLCSDRTTDSQVVRWITKYPYPMCPREYIFVRRRYVDKEQRSVVIVSSSLPKHFFPVSRDYVRVETYHSNMVVQAHTDFNEKGLDYVLTYYDNPEINISTYAYNWIVNHGGPRFLNQVHKAAMELERLRIEKQDEIENLESYPFIQLTEETVEEDLGKTLMEHKKTSVIGLEDQEKKSKTTLVSVIDEQEKEKKSDETSFFGSLTRFCDNDLIYLI